MGEAVDSEGSIVTHFFCVWVHPMPFSFKLLVSMRRPFFYAGRRRDGCLRISVTFFLLPPRLQRKGVPDVVHLLGRTGPFFCAARLGWLTSQKLSSRRRQSGGKKKKKMRQLDEQAGRITRRVPSPAACAALQMSEWAESGDPKS